jgi:hypothetical protein
MRMPLFYAGAQEIPGVSELVAQGFSPGSGFSPKRAMG